jgi:HEAT repeat protein
MYKNGIRFLLALLVAGGALPAQQPDLDEAFARLAKWNFDEPREPEFAVSELVAKAKGSPAALREIETRLIKLVTSDATLAAKDFACRLLHGMGTEAAAPALAGLLADSRTAEIARYALEGIPGPAAGRVLREALGKTSGRARIGVITSLGRRRDAAAVELLRPLAADPAPATAEAALVALAEIADPAALRILAESRSPAAAVASLKAADLLAGRGEAASAAAIYRRLYTAGQPGVIRAGALRGLAQSAPAPAEALSDSDPRVRAAAVDALARQAPAQLAAALPKLAEDSQVRALGVLAERKETATLPAFLAAVQGPAKAVRIAALEGLGRLGNASVVPTLAGIAAGEDEAERTAARAALGRLRGSDVDQRIAAEIAGAAPKVKLELIRAAGERGTPTAAGALLKMAREADPELRRESLRALRDTAGTGDIAALTALVVSPVQAGDRAEAGRALGAVLRRADPARIADVVSASTSSGDPEARAALMQVLGQSGNPQALAVLRAALKDPDAGLRRAAILALTDWPDPTPIADLLEAARAAADPAHQVLALRGALRLIGLPGSGRPPAETVKLLAEVVRLAKQADEKRAVLALLARFPTREALELARSMAGDAEVAEEAKAAVARLERVVKR